MTIQCRQWIWDRKFSEMKGVYHLNGYSLKNSDPEGNVFIRSHVGYLKVRNEKLWITLSVTSENVEISPVPRFLL